MSNDMSKEAIALKKAHLALMRHPKTALYSGVILMGKSEVVNAPFTAYTDGVNKKYSASFLKDLTDPERRALVLHENLHVALKHLTHGKSMFLEDKKLANVAADFVVNDIIMNITDTVSSSSREPLLTLPKGGVYDAKFSNWSMRQVYDYLRKKQKEREKQKPQEGKPCDDGESGSGGDQEQEQGGKPSDKYLDGDTDFRGSAGEGDEHDFEKLVEGLSQEEAKELSESIDRALREGGILAGRLGANVPRQIQDLLTPKINWRDELRDFVTSSIKGKDEYTWRKLNRRSLANDFITPSVENETIGRIIVAIDTSGSIGSDQITEFATELSSICETCEPDEVVVLWWDTQVHGKQVIDAGKYGALREILKPMGGGGTRVGCVSEYINEQQLSADCVMVFTDGYVEGDPVWSISSPTLWLVTQSNYFEPPVGKKVKFSQE